MADLTERQAAFVQEYLIDLNGTQAAIRAGYAESGASVEGSRLLANAKIASAIALAQAERLERTHVSQDRVIRELARLSFSDLRTVMDDNGGLLTPQEWDDDTAASIASIEVVTQQSGETDADGRKVVDRVHKIKTWDKNAALEKLAKHLGLYEADNKDKGVTIVLGKGTENI